MKKSATYLWTNKSFNSGIGQVDKSGLSIYPNPSQNMLAVNYGYIENSQLEFSIYNSVGELVYSQSEHQAIGRERLIDISGLAAGLYILNVKSDDDVITGRFVISR